MKTKLVILVIIITLAVIIEPNIVFGQFALMQKFNSGTPIIMEEAVPVALNIRGHKIFVKARINDSPDEYNFIFDTGAITMLSSRLAEKLGIEKGFIMPTPDSAREAHCTKEEVKIMLGEVGVDDFMPVIFDLIVSSDYEIDGFIGADFMRFYCVTLDYSEGTAIFSESCDEKHEKASIGVEMVQHVPLRFPLVECTINDSIKVKAMIDTGSPYRLVLPISLLDEYPELKDGPILKSRGLIAKWPFTSVPHNYLVRLPSFKIGDYEIADLPALCAELPGEVGFPLLGKGFLDNYAISLDYPGNELILNPIDSQKSECDYISAGLVFKKEDKSTRVGGIWESSSADLNGIEPGDYVITINSKKADDLSMDQLNAILNDESIKVIECLIKNESGERQVTLIKKNLLSDVIN